MKLLKLDNKRAVNFDNVISLFVGNLENQKDHHVFAALTNGQVMSLYMFDSEAAAQTKLDLLLKDLGV